MSLYERIISEETDFVPTPLRAFLRHGATPSSNGDEQTLDYYAHGYAAGFEVLAAAAIEDWPLREYLRLPMFAVGRHSIELALKSMIARFADARDAKPDKRLGHDVAALWAAAKAEWDLADLGDAGEFAEDCQKAVDHIQAIDPKAESLRYPAAPGGAPYSFTEMDHEQFIRAHFRITTFVDISLTMLDEAQKLLASEAAYGEG